MNMLQKRQRHYHTWNNRITLLLAVLLQHIFASRSNFQTFLQLTTGSFTNNAMQFTVSNNGTLWIWDFGPDSVVLSIKDQDENFAISSFEIPLAAWL